MLATEEEAIAWSNWGFSFSRLKVLYLTFLPILSVLGLDGLPKWGRLGPGERDEDVDVVETLVLRDRSA